MTNTSWPALQAAYITSLQAAGRRPLTIRQHVHYLRHLRVHAPSPTRITTAQLERFLSPAHWSPETRKSARAVAVSWCRWLHARGYLDRDPSVLLPSVRVPTGLPRPVPEWVLTATLRDATARERWMLLLGAHAGLRAGEIATVHRDRLTGRMLTVLGKGGKERVVPLVDDDLAAEIAAAAGYLFPGRIDGHLSPAYVSTILARLLPDHWTAHTLRHRAGTRAYAGTRDLLAVGAMLGHSKPETTMRYCRLPDDALWVVARAAAGV